MLQHEGNGSNVEGFQCCNNAAIGGEKQALLGTKENKPIFMEPIISLLRILGA